MTIRAGAIVLALSAAMAAGCGGVSSPPSAVGLDAAGRLERLVSADARAHAVFHRLITANHDLCPRTGVVAGWSLHAASQYGPALRPLAEDRFGLDGDLPGVLAAAPDGPADRAGLAPGDLILAVNDTVLARGDDGARADYRGLARNLEHLDHALRDAASQPVRLTVRRAGEVRAVRLSPVPACAYSLHMEPGEVRNARADGRGVFISAGLTHFAARDEDLALLLGHELAHGVLEHRTADSRLTAAGRAPDAERRADRAGLCLALNAGYDMTGAPAFWRRFGAADWRVRYPQLGHPGAETRARVLEDALADLAAGRTPADCIVAAGAA